MFAVQAILVRPSVGFFFVLLCCISSQFHHLMVLVRAGEYLADIVVYIDLALISSVQHFSKPSPSLTHKIH